ncbi:hypothetical protein TNCV_4134161 [Trichonephila clavipes]|nr:hypothetical protein TNCV_4134161 [Trichonephila clavipes]
MSDDQKISTYTMAESAGLEQCRRELSSRKTTPEVSKVLFFCCEGLFVVVIMPTNKQLHNLHLENQLNNYKPYQRVYSSAETTEL